MRAHGNLVNVQLGFAVSELLVELIQNPQAFVKKVILETELIIRESSAM